MVKIVQENGRFIYCNETENKILLDCNRYLENMSRVPMQQVEGQISIPKLLLDLSHQTANSPEIFEGENDIVEYFILDALVIRMLMRSSSAIKVLEMGCTNGRLSYHLASLMGQFHIGSLLCGVTDRIGNDSDNQWLDMVTQVETLPRLSLLAADYNETNLAERHFDIVILNGTISYHDPYAVIKEAERVCKKEGLILCYNCKQPMLESVFKLVFPETEIYSTDVTSSILSTYNIEESWSRPTDDAWDRSIEDVILRAEGALTGMTDKGQVVELIQELKYCTDVAVKHHATEYKMRCLALKEKILNCL